jgi:hypothetical protein
MIDRRKKNKKDVTKLLFNEIQVILQVLDSINYISKTKNKDQSGLENRPENRHDPAQAPEKPNGSSPDSQASATDQELAY